MSQHMPRATIISDPLIHFGREVCGDLSAALRREWLVANGLGGYASSTVAGINTRSYHGLLVAALNPPVDRTVLVASAVEWAAYDGKRYALSTNAYVDGTFDPQGYKNIHSFALEGTLPVWVFALADALVERRIWMAYGANTTYVSYRLLRGSQPVDLEVTPLVTYHGFHSLSSGQGWILGREAGERRVVIRAFESATPFAAMASSGEFIPEGGWWWNFTYQAETERGLGDRGDLYAPGRFQASLTTEAPVVTLTYTTEFSQPATDGTLEFAAARERQKSLLRAAALEEASPALQQLALAADQFIVERATTSAAPADEDKQTWEQQNRIQPRDQSSTKVSANKTVIAGYHWFNDWGRDTMIALPGLTLATGRPEDMANVLRSFAQYVSEGMLPNNFPDQSGQSPGYNTADATLWYVLALRAYAEATGDETLVDELLPVVRDIVTWHEGGTRYHIGVDQRDGLLYAGEPGVQLTWMDAKVGDLVVTPRIGKPVEINALWYNTLRTLATFLTARGDASAEQYATRAERVRESFLSRFKRNDGAGLADVVDGPAGDDWTVRPNQIFAVSLPFPLVEGADAANVVDAVGRALWTSYGLRSLDPSDPAYRGDYGGNQYQRDTAYHQGPVWTWLMGPYAEAHFQVHNDPVAALALLQPFEDHLRDAGLGSVSEILEGNPPHRPKGCIAQAWGVAETLRVWLRFEREARAAGVRPVAAGATSSSSAGYITQS